MDRKEFLYELDDLLTNFKEGIIIPTNKIILNGTIESEFRQFKTYYLEGYIVTISVKRKNSDVVDYVEVVIPKSKLHLVDRKATRMQIVGSVRTTFILQRLQFYVEAVKVGYDEGLTEDVNWLYIHARVAKTPKLKVTSKGNIVCNIDVKVYNVQERRRNYMPCVAFTKMAESMGCLEQWQKIAIFGRLCSRDYTDKRTGEDRRATEITVFFFKKILL